MRSARRERGETLVEFAFASVVFFMIVFGTFEFGLAVWHYNLVANLSQEGARWASVRGSTSNASPVADTSSVTSYVTGRALGMNLTQVTLTCGVPGGSLSACDCGSGSGAVTCIPGNMVQVNIQTTFTPGTALIPNGMLTLRSAAQMLITR